MNAMHPTPTPMTVTVLATPSFPGTLGPARLARWRVEDGARVESGQPVAELEIDKVVLLLHAPAAGRLRYCADENAWLDAGAPVAHIAVDVHAHVDASGTKTETEDTPSSAPAAPRDRSIALPPAGPFAEDEGFDPAEIDAASAPPEPLPPVRAVTARRLAMGARQAPCFALEMLIDMSSAVHLRQTLRAQQAAKGKATYNDMLLWAAARAVARHPRVAAVWTPAGLVRRDAVNIGFAMALDPEGLVVPVLRDADRLDLFAVARQVLDLSRRAREGRLAPADYAEGVFTITNLGTYPIDAFTAVVNPGEAAILAAGRVFEGPWVENGALGVRWQMRVTLTADHRVLDGAEGARFLATLKALLERIDIEILLAGGP